MEATQVQCPNCSTTVPGTNINIAALLAKCDLCSHVFQLPQARETSAAAVSSSRPSRPSGIVHDAGPDGELYLRRNWFTPALFFLLFFCIAWDSFLVFWYSMALFGGKNGGGGDWGALLFPIGHVAVGVGLTYFVVAGFLNKTQILVDGQDIHIRHKPVPWWGNRILPVADVQGFELDRSVTKNGNDTITLSGHHTDGRQIVLLSSLPPRQAEYIGHVLAEHLKVPLNRNYDNPNFDARKAVARAFRRFKRTRKTEE